MSFIIIQEIMALRRPEKIRDNIYYQYSQVIDGVVYNMCWMFAPIISLSSLFNIQLSKDQIKQFIDGAFAEWLPNGWQAIQIGAEYVTRKRNQTFPQYQAVWRGGMFGDTNMRPHLRRWKPIVLHIRTGQKYREDREDGVLHNLVYRKEDKTSAHAISIMRLYDKYYMVDSRWDGKKYLISRQYLETVKWFIETRRNPNIIYFDKA